MRRLVRLALYCLHTQKDTITAALVSRTKEVWPDLKSEPQRNSTFNKLLEAGLLEALPKRGKVEPCMPVY